MIKAYPLPLILGSALLLTACSGESETPAEDAATGGATEYDGGETLTVENQPGPAIGDRAPVDLSLADADGDTMPLSERTGEKGTILVFTRSVDWCPYCQGQLKKLNDVAGDLKEQGYTVAGVSYDPVTSLKEFSNEQKISYTLLSDQGSKLIDAFAIRDPQYADADSRAYGVPYASIFVLDSDGVVRAKSVSSDYKVRPTNDELALLVESAG
jgi:peroxiredoxin